MTANTQWYSDPEKLLEEVQLGDREKKPPLNLDGYDDLKEMCRGGQGIVYTGIQRSTKRAVAIKVLIGGDFASASRRRRFEREIDIVASLRHPNIVSIYDSGLTDNDSLYFVMEFVDGLELDEYVREHCRLASEKGSQKKILELFIKACDAVQFAHQHGVIHRDLKPSNIRVDGAGEPRVLDFGLAKANNDAPANVHMSLTKDVEGQFIGSLAWASPEQAEGAVDRVNIHSDVYSLGVILFGLLADEFPYDVHGTMREVLDGIVNTDPCRPSSINPAIDLELDTVILKCLSKEPDRRYQSVGELARDIRRYLAGEPIEARRDSTWYVVSKQLRRYRLVASISAFFLVLTLILAVTLGVLYSRATSAETLAQQRLLDTQIETEKTVAINDFLHDMLRSVDVERDGYQVTVADVLSRAHRELGARFDDHPEIKASLLDTVGTSFYGLGRFKESVQELTQCYELRRTSLGLSHRDTIDTMARLAMAHLNAGDISEANRVIEQAATAAKGSLEPDDITSMLIRHNMALIRYDQGSLADAIEIAREVLESQRRVLGDNHSETLSTLRMLGGFLQADAQFVEAEVLLREAQQRCQETLGDEHPDTLTATNNLALLLEQIGQWQEAERLLRRLVRIQTNLRGATHPEVLTAKNNLAVVLQSQSQLTEAATIYGEVLDARRQIFGTRHEMTLVSMNNLARVLHDQGKLQDAMPLLREAYETMRSLLGESHPKSIIVLGAYAGILSDLGEMEQAGRLFKKSLQLCRDALGEDHPSTLIAMNNLAGIWRDQGRFQEALTMYEQCLERAVKVFPEDHYFIHICRNASGACLTGLARYEEAEPLLVRSHKALRRLFGADHARTNIAADRLTELYKSWNREDKK